MKASDQHIALLTALSCTPANIAAAQAIMDIDRRAHGVRRDSFSAWGLSDEMEKAEDNPDYVGRLPELTLDLCHEAENHLMECGDVYDRYLSTLGSICVSNRAVSATKEQRREALLRVKGLWVE